MCVRTVSENNNKEQEHFNCLENGYRLWKWKGDDFEGLPIDQQTAILDNYISLGDAGQY